MKTVLITNQKGGCGKTTISTSLAFRFEEEGIPFNYYDMDQQGGALFAGHKDENAVVNIVDTPGSLQKDLKKWIEESDYIIVPSLVGVFDVDPLKRMIELLSNYPDKKILFVFNRWTRFNNAKDFINWFENNWPNLDTAILANSTAFDDAFARGIPVTKYRPSSQVTKQIQEIYTLVKHGLNLKEGWR